MIEEIIKFGDNSNLVGIITFAINCEKQKDCCVILLNAGMIHKVGVNRINVKIARSLSNKGFTCFRFDFSGVGDSEIIREYKSLDQLKIDEIKQAMAVVKDKTGINKFCLKGICSGAEIAFKASLKDYRITKIILIDGIYQDKELIHNIIPIARKCTTIRYYKKKIINIKNWIKIFTRASKMFKRKNLKAGFHSKFKILLTSIPKPKNENLYKFSTKDWEVLIERKVNVYLIFCEGGLYIDLFNLTVKNQLNKFILDGLLKVELIKNVDHTFTPIWTQDLLINKIYSWLID